ncbi:surface antigen [Marmoricola bigeumensis]|uniref:Surface antigen n=2 Tax=Nocardioides marmoribigeumensis TaxID=433649 RepID=A0ABU2BW70_9ACTN|nr:surface antigen [Nocardioides marmoribigeumensis]
MAAMIGMGAARSPASADSYLCYVKNSFACISGQAAGGIDTGYRGAVEATYVVDQYKNNCTNYAAYRLRMNGVDPAMWKSLGNADQWDDNARARGIPVNGTPAVGSIAQWNSQHVAYVEEVAPDASWIRVTESGYGPITLPNGTRVDSMSGHRTITRAGRWPDNFIHFKDLPASGPTSSNRILAVTTDGTLLGKDGMNGQWVTLTGGVTAAYSSGERIVALFKDGKLRGKQGLNGAWVDLLDYVVRATVAGDRILAITTDGTLVGKVGMNGAWVTLARSVKRVYATDKRIVALFTDGFLRGKDGLNDTWVTLVSGTRDAAVAGERIVAVQQDGTLLGKDGLGGTWVNLLGGVKNVYLTGQRIVALSTDGVLRGKDGMNGTWVTLAGGTRSVAVDGERIIAVQKDDNLIGKDRLDGTWVTLTGGTKTATLAGQRIIAVQQDGALVGKEGLNGGWVRLLDYVADACIPDTSACDPRTFRMINTSAPTVSGTPRVGVRLAASPGSWSPSGSYAYRWLADGTVISGATGPSYVPTVGVRGKRISVRVTASRPGYISRSATSARTAAVAPGVITNSTLPSISGVRRVGSSLTASPGSWSPGSLTFRYQWFRGTTAISGTTSRSYTLPRISKGHRMRVRVTASRTGYTSRAAYSPYTATIG